APKNLSIGPRLFRRVSSSRQFRQLHRVAGPHRGRGGQRKRTGTLIGPECAQPCCNWDWTASQRLRRQTQTASGPERQASPRAELVVVIEWATERVIRRGQQVGGRDRTLADPAAARFAGPDDLAAAQAAAANQHRKAVGPVIASRIAIDQRRAAKLPGAINYH